MAAQSFKEWFDIVTEIGDQDPFSGFTSKGIAHLGWDAAIKSLEGVQTQTTNSRVMPCPAFSVRSSCFVTHDMNCGTEACEIPIRART